MKRATANVDAPADLNDSPHELSRAMLEARFPVVLEVRSPWRRRTKAGLIDFMAIDAALRTWWVAVAGQDERLPLLVKLMTDRKLARHARDGDRVQVWSWSRRPSGLVVEVVELGIDDFA